MNSAFKKIANPYTSTLIGEMVDSVAVVAKNINLLYMLTTPVSLSLEASQRRKTELSVNLMSVWPAPSVFISAVALNVKLLTAHVTKTTIKILILSYSESPDSIECK